jgi:hypothetical protein
LIELIEYAEILAGILFLAVVAVLCVKYAIIPLIAAIKYAALPQDEKVMQHIIQEIFKEYRRNPDVLKMHAQRRRFSGEPMTKGDYFLMELDKYIQDRMDDHMLLKDARGRELLQALDSTYQEHPQLPDQDEAVDYRIDN